MNSLNAVSNSSQLPPINPAKPRTAMNEFIEASQSQEKDLLLPGLVSDSPVLNDHAGPQISTPSSKAKTESQSPGESKYEWMPFQIGNDPDCIGGAIVPLVRHVTPADQVMHKIGPDRALEIKKGFALNAIAAKIEHEQFEDLFVQLPDKWKPVARNLVKIMPSLKELRAASHADKYSEELWQASKSDPFMNVRKSETYADLRQQGLTAAQLADLLFLDTTLEKVVAQVPRDQILALLCRPELRVQLGLSIPLMKNFESYKRSYSALLASCNWAEQEWQKVLPIIKSRKTTTDYLDSNHKEDFIAVMLKHNFLANNIEKLGKSDVVDLEWNEKLDSLVSLINDKTKVFKQVLMKHLEPESLPKTTDTHKQGQKLPLKDQFIKFIDSCRNTDYHKEGQPRNRAEELVDLVAAHFVKDKAQILKMMNELLLQSSYMGTLLTHLNALPDGPFLRAVVTPLPAKVYNDLAGCFVDVNNGVWILPLIDKDNNNLEEWLSTKLTDGKKLELAAELFPFRKLVEIMVSKLLVLIKNRENKQSDSSKEMKVHLKSVSSAKDDLESDEEDDFEEIDRKKKLTKLYQPHLNLLEDYWFEKSKKDWFSMWSHCSFKVKFGFLSSLGNTDYSLVTIARQYTDDTLNCDKRFVSFSIIFDSKSSIVATLPGVYMGFVHLNQLVTFRIIGSSENSENSLNLERQVVIYELNNFKKPIFIGGSAGSDKIKDLEELNMTVNFDSACELHQENYMKLIYCNDKNQFRVIIANEIDYGNSSLKYKYSDVSVKVDLGTKVHIDGSKPFNCYFFDFGTKLAVFDQKKKKVIYFKVEYEKENVKTTFLDEYKFKEHESFDPNFYQYCKDAYSMSNCKAFQPLFISNVSESHVLEFKETITTDKISKSLKEKLKIQGEIKSFVRSGDYVFYLATEDNQSNVLTIAQTIDDSLEILGTFAAGHYDNVAFNGKLVVLSEIKDQILNNFSVISFSLRSNAEIIKSENHKLDQKQGRYINLDMLFSSEHSYGYFTSTEIIVQNWANGDEISKFNINKIKEKYFNADDYRIDSKIWWAIFNENLSYAVFSLDINRNLYCVNLKDYSFYRINLKIEDDTCVDSLGRYLVLYEKLIMSVYYLDNFGRLKLLKQYEKIDFRDSIFNICGNAWTFKAENQNTIGYRDLVLNESLKMKDYKIGRSPNSRELVAFYSPSEIIIYQIDYSQFPVVSQKKNEYPINNIKELAITKVSGKIHCYFIKKEKTYALYKLNIIADKDSNELQNTDLKIILDFETANSYNTQVVLQFNSECTSLMLFYVSGNQKMIKIFNVNNNDVIYQIDVTKYDVRAASSIFKFSESQFSIVLLAGDDSEKTVKKIEEDINDETKTDIVEDDDVQINTDNVSNIKDGVTSIQRIQFTTNLLDRIESKKRFILILYNHLKDLGGAKNNKKLQEDKLKKIETFLTSFEPYQLLKEKAIFVILVKLEREDILKIYLEHCTLRRLISSGNLLEWIFSTGGAGRVIRKYLLDNFNDAFYANDGELDYLQRGLFKDLLNYKYMQKRLIEPESRQIFMRLLRTPLTHTSDGQRQIVELDVDPDELDADYDNGMILNIPKDSSEQDIRELIAVHLDEKKDFKGHNQTTYQMFVSSTEVDFSIGGKERTDLFRLLAHCPNEELNDILRPFIYLQWMRLYPYAFSYVIFYWIYASLCYVFYGYMFTNRGIGITLIVMSIIFLAYEAISIRENRLEYLKSPWNYLDLMTYVACIVTVPMLWTFDVQTPGWAVGRSIIFGSIWFRAITWLKIFRAVRYLITMVLRVYYDMIAFMTVLITVVFGFSLIWRLSFYFPPSEDSEVTSREDLGLVPSFFSSLQVVSFIILGNLPSAESDDREFSVIRFLVVVWFGVALALALTNILIAVVNSTYGDIAGKKEHHDLREVLDLVVDFNSSAAVLRFCSSKFKTPKYYLSIHKKIDDPPKEKSVAEDFETGFTEKFLGLDASMVQMTDLVKQKFNDLERNLITKIDEKISDIHKQKSNQVRKNNIAGG